MPKIILFNGPPRAGKDTCTNFALKTHLGGRGLFYRFAEPLKHATHELYGLNKISCEFFNSTKETPNADFLGKSPRAAYIEVSEKMVKPVLGEDFFAKIAVNFIKRACAKRKDRVIVICDCGFNSEVKTLVEAFGEDNVAIVHLYRPGRSFEGDSRNYVETFGAAGYRINNDGSFKDLQGKIKDILDDFLKEKDAVA